MMEEGCAGVPESGSCGSGGRPFAADMEVDAVNITMSGRPQEDEVRT
jgi:hypothetical protein